MVHDGDLGLLTGYLAPHLLHSRWERKDRFILIACYIYKDQTRRAL